MQNPEAVLQVSSFSLAPQPPCDLDIYRQLLILPSPKEKFRHHQLRSVLDDGKVEDEPWENMRLSGLCQAHAEAENDTEHGRNFCSNPCSCGWDVIAIGRR